MCPTKCDENKNRTADKRLRCECTVRAVYKSSSECYRRVMSEGRLDACSAQWTQLGHVLSNASAYEFYCSRPDDTNRRQIVASVSFRLSVSSTSGKGRLGSRAVSVLDSGAEGPGFKSQSRRCRCRVTVLGKLFTPIVPLFTKQQNW